MTAKEKQLTVQLLTEKIQRLSGKKIVLKEDWTSLEEIREDAKYFDKLIKKYGLEAVTNALVDVKDNAEDVEASGGENAQDIYDNKLDSFKDNSWELEEMLK